MTGRLLGRSDLDLVCAVNDLENLETNDRSDLGD